MSKHPNTSRIKEIRECKHEEKAHDYGYTEF